MFRRKWAVKFGVSEKQQYDQSLQLCANQEAAYSPIPEQSFLLVRSRTVVHIACMQTSLCVTMYASLPAL